MTDPRSYLAEHRPAQLEELFKLLRIPSVSAVARHRGDILSAAGAFADLMRRSGLERVAVLETGGHPVVYGEHLHSPGHPTVLVYGHYDVQPPEPLELWHSPPFEPEVRDGRIFARGSTDDKGQVTMHILVAGALIGLGALPLNLKFLIEGEEEIGSVHLGDFIAQHKDLLAADYVVISDSTMLRPGVPALCIGLRGLAGLELRLRTAQHDLHSGTFGGAVPNAAHVLVDLLASLHDSEGRVSVEGFYDDVKDLTPSERRAFASLPLTDAEFLDQSGAYRLYGESGRTTLERVWTRPTLELNGIWSGFTGEGRKTVIPCEAGAKITCRLVPNQDPDKVLAALARHLRRHCPDTTQLEIMDPGGAPAFLAPQGHPALRAAELALREAYGHDPDVIRMGGSIPVVTAFQEILGLPTLLMGFGLPDENLHAPDEHFSLENFAKGMVALWRFWQLAA